MGKKVNREGVPVIGVSRHRLGTDGTDFSYFYHNKVEYRLSNQDFRINYIMVRQALMPNVQGKEILTDVVDATNNPLLLKINIY